MIFSENRFPLFRIMLKCPMLADVPQMTWFADIKMRLWLFVDKMDGE
jgi:hypothetical protein